LENEGQVRLAIFDVLGPRVITLIHGHQSAGQHTISWSGKDEDGGTVASGMYFYRLTIDD
jgi:flagellar hook assembly protein FlgD